MKLELKHLAPYLSNGLTVKTLIGEIDELDGHEKTFKLIGLINDKASIQGIQKHLIGLDKCFPILRPLSDLKEFHINNIDFTMGGLSAYGILRRIQENPKQGNFNMLEFLYQNHFDVFGLIDKGLAIDINTLNK